MQVVHKQGRRKGYSLSNSNPPKTFGSRSVGCERKPPMVLPKIEPITQTRPYIAKASVELLSSVRSPMAARTTATLPLRAPDRHRVKIICQKVAEKPLEIIDVSASSTGHACPA